VEEGLGAASVRGAAVPGIPPRLKDRLIEHGIGSAADVDDTMPELQGLGETERRSLLEWRESILAGRQNTGPGELPHEQLEAIRQTYQALHDQNNLAERRALASLQLLQHELMFLRPDLRQLERVTFMGYLSKSLAPRALVAAMIALLLIGTQLASSFSATAALLRPFLP
jgi:hypothetical protein